MEAVFRDLDSVADADRMRDFMARSPRHYPNYDGWLEMAYCQLLEGSKKGCWCRYDGAIVASLTWQTRHGENFVAELKNMRVDPGWRGRDIGGFLLRSFELQAAVRHTVIRCDLGSDNRALGFFLRHGYRKIGVEDLYRSGMKDILLAKTVGGIADGN